MKVFGRAFSGFLLLTLLIVQSGIVSCVPSKKSAVQSRLQKVNRNRRDNLKQSSKISRSLISQSILNIPITGGPAKTNDHDSHKMTMGDLITNIVADLCPHGMMPLAYGFAQGGPSGLIPSITLLVVFGSMSAYTMLSLSRLATSTNSKSLGEVWGKLISKKTEWVVDLAIFALCFGCCIFYSAFIGDMFTNVGKALGLAGYFATRWVVLSAISVFVLLPLCLLEDMSALHFSSIVGVIGIVYTTGFTLFRLFDGSYSGDGALLDFVEEKYFPEWDGGFNLWKVNTGTIVLANMICLGFLSHYNALNYYFELSDASEKRYETALRAGFGITSCIFIAMMCAGYSLFGNKTQPLLLNNFPVSADILASVARVATGLAITFAYPLMFAGLKSSMYSLIIYFTTPAEQARKSGKPKVKDMDKNVQLSAIVLVLALISALAIKFSEEQIGLVLGIVGSLLGCFAAYILPGMLRLVQMRERALLGMTNRRLDVLINHALIAIGTIFGGLGVWITLKSEFDHMSTEEYF